MPSTHDKDTVILRDDRKDPLQNRPAFNFGAIPVKLNIYPAPAPVPPFPKQAKPLPSIRLGKWSFKPKFKQRGYVPYLMGVAFALLLGVAGVVIYLVAFETRPPSAAAQSGIKKIFTLNLQTSAGSGEPGSQDGFGSDASFNSPSGVTADTQGNIYVCDTNNNAVRKINTTGFVSTLAGNASRAPGFADGKRGVALFNAPIGITFDSTSGLLYVVDSNNSLIRQVDPADGAVLTIAGNLTLQPDFQDGQATSASFSNPFGIASDSFQNLYITDYGNNLVRKINGSGYVSTIAGVRTDESRRFGAAFLTNLNHPLAITIDSAGNLYFVNEGSSQVLKITTMNDVTTIAPFVNLTAATSRPSSPTTAIAVDSNNNLWIVQSPPPSGASQSQSFQIVSIATEAVQNISLPTSAAPFGYIAFKRNGDLVSSSDVGNLVLSFSISVVFDNGTISRSSSTLTVASSQSNQVSTSMLTESSSIQFSNPLPTSVLLESSSNQLNTMSVSLSTLLSSVYPITSTTSNPYSPILTKTKIQALTSDFQSSSTAEISSEKSKAPYQVSTSVSQSPRPPSATSSELMQNGNQVSTTVSPRSSLASTSSLKTSNLFSAESPSSASAIPSESPTYSNQASTSVSSSPTSSVSPTAEPVYLYNVTTLAGSGSATFSDGVGLAASFNFPTGVAVDSNGTVYVADHINHRIRKINLSGNVTTLAGSGSAAFADGVGVSASFNYPYGIAVDSNGTVYVADYINHRIRKISQAGNVTTLAGSGSAAFADGMGVAASFQYPQGVAVDSIGSIYVADTSNQRIRKISFLGVVTTLAGSGSPAFADGVGAAASFQYPAGVAVDSNGTVYVGDPDNNRIRKINLSGAVHTFAGSGVPDSTDGLGSAASFNAPTGVAVDSDGSIYVADFLNNRIRKISRSGNVTTLAGSGSSAFADGVGLLASFNTPVGVAVDSNGSIYVADRTNHRIRKITLVLA